MERGQAKSVVISALTASVHGKLDTYLPVGVRAATDDPEFFAHLVAWAYATSELKDVRTALPVIGLAQATIPEIADNAAAHLALLDPRLFLRAMDFARGKISTQVQRRLVTRYLRDKEAEPATWMRTALQHRTSLKRLYAVYHVQAAPFAAAIVMRGEAPKGTVFAALRALPIVSPTEAAGLIMKHKIPFLIAAGALKAKMKSVDVLLALMQQMTPGELVTNTKTLVKLGIKDDPALRSAFEAALGKAASSTKRKSTLKTSQAAAHVGDAQIKAKLDKLQEQQLAQGGVDGDWLVMGDKSASMEHAITTACDVAASLARSVKGQVHLVFFDEQPRYFNVTGKTLDEIRSLTRLMRADSNTSIGCGLLYLLERQIVVNGIAIVSDGGENRHPIFAPVYQDYVTRLNLTPPPVYFYKMKGSTPNVLSENCARRNITLTEFDLTGQIDYYSLGEVTRTMRASRYALLDEIMVMPLKTLDEVLSRTAGMDIWRRRAMVQA